MFYERFTELCKLNGKTPTGVGLELGFSRGSVARWKNGEGVTAKSLGLIADYFGVSTDFLLGRENKKTDPDFLGGLPYVEYADLSKQDRQFVDDLIRRMHESKKEK